MTSDLTLVVRYDESGRAAVEQTLRRLVRRQGILLVILGMLFGLLVLVPLIAAATAADGINAPLIFAAVALLLVPTALGALGVRQLRRQPHVPEVAVTITPDAVLFPALDRPSALAPRIRAEEWSREGTSAEIIPASGLQAARVEFIREDGGRRRRRSIAADNIDVDPRVIVDALTRPHAP
ncbi:hypothetical protein AB0N73_05250 [Microbacterium sp. NPDC089189]|uniref:hypothetical protein n=1 Tax=Microbacterium sp. NPDC089189 TaxID=3154972 RepID=UPI0034403DF1